MSFQYTPVGQDPVKPTTRPQRRATVRYRCAPATLGRVFIAESYKSQDAWVLNLSVTGTGLLLDHAPEVGSWILIELDGATQDVPLELSAQVMHASRQHDGSYVVGCAFAQPLHADDLETLL